MPQIHCYVTREINDRLKKLAEDQGMTISAYLRKIVNREISKDWPKGFFEEVTGGWKGDPLERLPQGEYDIRGPLNVPARHKRLHQDSK